MVRHCLYRSILNLYYDEISMNEILSEEEEVILFKKLAKYRQLKKLDKVLEIKNRIICCNLKLVIKIAQKYQGYNVQLEDLIGEGNLGLIVAIDKFSVDKGYKFSTYSTFWIKQAIIQYIANNRSDIKIPMYIQRVLKIYDDVENYLNQIKLSKVSEDEVCIFLQKPISQISRYKKYFQETYSLNEVDKDDNYLLTEKISNENSLDPFDTLHKKHTKEIVLGSVNKLTEKERNVLMWRYGLSGSKTKTLKETGECYGVSRERARQIQSNALNKIKITKQIKDYADFIN